MHDERVQQNAAAVAGHPSRDPGQVNLLYLPGPLQGVRAVARVDRGQAEFGQGHVLAGDVADLACHRQRVACVRRRLGQAAEVPQRRRPARQAVHQVRRSGLAGERRGDRAVVIEQGVVVGRALGQVAHPDLSGMPGPRLRARPLRRPLQQRGSLDPPAAQPPPRRQRHGQAQRGGRIVVKRPGHALVYGGVLGVEPLCRGQFTVTGRQAMSGLLGHLEHMGGQRRTRHMLLARVPQPVPGIGPQRLEHRVPGAPVRPGPRRREQGAVDQVQHAGTSVGPGHRHGRVQRERAGEHRQVPQ